MVGGRKNHFGSRKRGTEVAALFYSLIEMAKLCLVNAKSCLLEATHAALTNPGTAAPAARPAQLTPAPPRSASSSWGNRECLPTTSSRIGRSCTRIVATV